MICDQEAAAETDSCTSVCPSPKAKNELGKPHAEQTHTDTVVSHEKKERNKTKRGINQAGQPLGLAAARRGTVRVAIDVLILWKLGVEQISSVPELGEK